MIDVTNKDEIAKLDPKNVFGSTEMFADQLQQMFDTYADTDFFEKFPEYKTVENVVICGMGGSAYGSHIIQSLFHDSLKIPVIVNSDYHLPGFVNQNSLVLLTSYSGTTEEVLSCAKEAQEKKIKVAVLASGLNGGGQLGEILQKENIPGFTFEPKFNPSTQPRLGTGYIVLGSILLLRSLGIISINKEELASVIAEVKQQQNTIKQDALAKAQQIMGFLPVIFAAEHLNGNAHILRNQCNETSKSFSAYSELPELNHHLMEGLQNPQDKKLIFLFLDSAHYSAILQKRLTLTKDVIEKNKLTHITFSAPGSTKFAHMLTTLSFGGYLTVYLALLYGLDPSLIPWVDYFKEQLKSAQ